MTSIDRNGIRSSAFPRSQVFLMCFVLWCTYTRLIQEYGAFAA
jgi:hypothetical protein